MGAKASDIEISTLNDEVQRKLKIIVKEQGHDNLQRVVLCRAKLVRFKPTSSTVDFTYDGEIHRGGTFVKLDISSPILPSAWVAAV